MKINDIINEINMDHRTTKGDFDKYDLDDFIGLGRKVGNIDGYDIWMNKEDDEIYWLVADPEGEGFLGYVLFIYNRGDKFYRSNVFFDPSIQGKGLAVKMYAAAIRQSDITIVSDKTQTEGSKALWKKLAKMPGINVYGWDRYKKDSFFHWDPDVETDEEVWADTDALGDQHAEILRKIRELDYEFGQHEMSEEEYEEARERLVQMTKDIQNQGPSGRNDIRLVATTA